MSTNPQTQKILVIRSAARVFSQTLNSLKSEFPESKITVLAPESIRESVSLDPLVDEVITLRDGKRITVFNYGLKNIRELRNRRFDLAVSLYNIDHGMGYSNIDILAWTSGAKTLRGYNSKGTFSNLTGTDIFKKSLFEKTGFVWSALNMLATVVLFTLITLGLIGEWCYRKLFPTRNLADMDFSHARVLTMEEESRAVSEPEKELTGV